MSWNQKEQFLPPSNETSLYVSPSFSESEREQNIYNNNNNTEPKKIYIYIKLPEFVRFI
jgi:hypothetical protein